MVQPINYMLDVQNPVQTAMTGLTQGMQIGQFMQAKEQAEREAIQKQQMQEELSVFASKPNKTHDDYANIMARFPSLAENFQKSYNVLDAGRQQASFKTASRAYAAAAGGRTDIAKSILETEALGYENAGDAAQAEQMRNLAKMADQNPNGFLTSTGLFLASANPDKFKDTLGALGENQMLPEEINLKKAQTAKMNAETLDIPLAARDRRAGVENQGKKIEYDNQYNYDKLSQDQQLFYDGLDKTERIEADKLRSSKAESSIQRVERLEKVEGYANAATQASESSKTAARLAGLAKDYAGAFSIARRVPGNNFYTFAQDIETLKSQVFLTQIEKMRGLGALTDKEGDAIRSSIASLDISQHPKVVQKNLTTIAQQMAAAAKSANRKAQLYATKGNGYSRVVIDTARERGVTPAEMQKIANELGIQ